MRIAGAGLSGLATAITLARRGHRVEVLERRGDSGRTRRADWDAIENWTTPEDLLDLLGDWGIEPSFAWRGPLEFEVIDERGERWPVRTRRPLFYLLRRGPVPGSLEQSLKAQAQDAGVRIRYGRAAERGEVDVWAAGAPTGGFFLGTGFTFRTRHEDVVVGLVDRRVAPRAYAYLVVVDGEGTLAVVLTRDFRNARTYLERAVAAFRRANDIEMSDVRPSSGFGGLQGAFLRSGGSPRAAPLTIGEAAGYQDFLWGFGIRTALYSGRLAAVALDEGLDYAALVGRELGPLVAASLANRVLYDLFPPAVERLFIRWFAGTGDLAALTRRWYRPMALHRVLWPLARRRYGRDRQAAAPARSR